MTSTEAKAEAIRRWGHRGAVHKIPANKYASEVYIVGREEDRSIGPAQGRILFSERLVPLGSGASWEEAFEAADRLEEAIRG